MDLAATDARSRRAKRGEIDLARGRLLPWPMPAHRLRAIGEAERRAAEEALTRRPLQPATWSRLPREWTGATSDRAPTR